MKKEYIIALVIIAVIVIYYFSTKNTDTGTNPNKSTGAGLGNTNTETITDPFEREDIDTLNSMIAHFNANASDGGALSWVNPLVLKSYNNGEYLLGGRKSKAYSFLRVIGMLEVNSTGKFTNSNGVKILWPQHATSELWNISANFRAKWSI